MPIKRGTELPQTVVDDDMVRAIRQFRRLNVRVRDIAALARISRVQVWRIATRRSRKSVTEVPPGPSE